MITHRARMLLLHALLALPLLAPGLAAPGELSPPEDLPALEHGKLATSDATPVDPGILEIELSYGPSWSLRGAGSFDRAAPGHAHEVGLGLTYGLLTGLDAAVSAGWASAYDAAWDLEPGDGISGPEHGQGLTDVAAGARWRFLRRAGSLELALLGGVVAPAGARASVGRVGISQEHWSADLALVGSGDRGAVTANAEIGASVPFGARRGSARGTLFANVAAGWHVRPWLQPELELNYERAWSAGPTPGPESLSVTAGVVAPFGDGYRIVAGAQYAVWGRHTAQTVAATVAFKWAY